MTIGANHRRDPNLYRVEHANTIRPARRRALKATGRERESVHLTWRCGNRFCRQWTQAAAGAPAGRCNHCGEARP